MMFSDEMRRQLGLGDPSFEIGTWWCVPHDAVTHHKGGSYPGQPFARKSRSGDGRRVVLATEYGPNATLFARSASIESTYEHPAHVHPDGGERCKLDRQGWVNFRLPVSVEVDRLGNDNFSCEEPDGTSLLAAISKALAL